MTDKNWEIKKEDEEGRKQSMWRRNERKGNEKKQEKE